MGRKEAWRRQAVSKAQVALREFKARPSARRVGSLQEAPSAGQDTAVFSGTSDQYAVEPFGVGAKNSSIMLRLLSQLSTVPDPGREAKT